MNKPKSLSDIERTEKIAELNDRLRTQGRGGQILVTSVVGELEEKTRNRLFQAIMEFDAFNKDCDPYGEHDFGVIKLEGQSYYFKIDTYDQNLEYASPDPLDEAVTKRVMTVLRADEY